MTSPYLDLVETAVETIGSLAALEPQVDLASQQILTALRAGNRLLICGNGGSAADASHLAAEFVIRFSRERRSLPAIALMADGAVLTAAGNDYGFDEVFARQIEGLAQPGDWVIVFSTSGNSQNIVRALEVARARHLKSLAFLGKGGGKCHRLATIEFLVASHVTAHIQEAHQFLMHALCELIDAAFAEE